MAWIPGQSQTSKASPEQMQTPFQLFYMYSSLQALAVLQTGVQAAPSVSGNLKTENAETIYIQCTMHLDLLKKNLLSLRLRFSFLFLRHTRARAIPAPARSITSRTKCTDRLPWPRERGTVFKNSMSVLCVRRRECGTVYFKLGLSLMLNWVERDN